jgi:hypothetical protein
VGARFLLILVFFASTLTARAATVTALPVMGTSDAVVIVIEGMMTIPDADEFRVKVSQYAKGTVVFKSGGGQVLAGVEIGKIIRLRNFATWVPSGSYCASACAIAWLGGTPRSMGKSALVGFHAAYRVQDGHAQESGMGNALVGSFLGQIGLSDSAIMYVTAAAPESIAWLTPAEATRVGIDVKVFDPPIDKPSSGSQEVASMRSRTVDFIASMYRAVNGPPDTWVSWAKSNYADQISYFGEALSRDEMIARADKWFARWPSRRYVPRESSYEIFCETTQQTCKAKGTLDFRAESLERQESSTGVATFDIALSFEWVGGPRIISENGQTLERHKGAIDLQPNAGAKDDGDASGPKYRVKANDGFVNIRRGPGTKYPIIVTLPNGTSDIALFGCEASQVPRELPFCKARWHEYVGWVSSCCVVRSHGVSGGSGASPESDQNKEGAGLAKSVRGAVTDHERSSASSSKR